MKPRHLLLTVISLLLVWQLFSALLDQPILPSPFQVASAFLEELISGALVEHALTSLWRVIASTLLAIALAVPAGLLLGQSRRLNGIFSPAIYLLYPIPKVVLVPIVLLIFGIGDLPKIILIFLVLFFQILVLVRDQAAGIRPELILSVRSLGAGRRALFRFVYLPASLPAILTALRQSVGTAIAVLYVAELFATQKGLGYYIYFNGSTLFNYPAMYAGIITLSFIGLVLYFMMDWLERKVAPWQTNHEPLEEIPPITSRDRRIKRIHLPKIKPTANKSP